MSISITPIAHLLAGAAGRHPEVLTSREELFRALTHHTPVGIFVSNTDGRCEYVNRRWTELTGLESSEAYGDGWLSAIHPADRERVEREWRESAASGKDSVAEYRFIRPDGTVSWIEGYATAMRNDDGDVIGWVGTCLDLTARRSAEEAVVAASERFRASFDNAPIGMGTVSIDGRWLQANEALCAVLGYTEKELRRLTLDDVTPRGERVVALGEHRQEAQFVREDESLVWVAFSSSIVFDRAQRPLYAVVQIEDIGDRKRAERELRRLADYDSLTGLMNRRCFLEALRRALRTIRRDGGTGALLVLDLDDFKVINDTAGHPEGDRVLRAAAEAMRRRLRTSDLVGRLGGDEFAALLMDVTPEQAEGVAEEIMRAVEAITVEHADTVLTTSVSVGIGMIDDETTLDEDALLADADRAMYERKAARRDS